MTIPSPRDLLHYNNCILRELSDNGLITQDSSPLRTQFLLHNYNTHSRHQYLKRQFCILYFDWISGSIILKDHLDNDDNNDTALTEMEGKNWGNKHDSKMKKLCCFYFLHPLTSSLIKSLLFQLKSFALSVYPIQQCDGWTVIWCFALKFGKFYRHSNF